MGFQEEKYNINNMKSNISRLGVMLSSHYDIEIQPESGSLVRGLFNQPPLNNKIDPRDFTIRASKVTLPGKTIKTTTAKPFGVDYEHPTEKTFDKTLRITFLNDASNLLRNFFYNWQNLIVDEFGNHRFRNEYACTIRIASEYQNDPKRQVRFGSIYNFRNAFPRVVTGNEFSSAQPNPIEFDVEFDYLVENSESDRQGQRVIQKAPPPPPPPPTPRTPLPDASNFTFDDLFS
jgi:hypothetical protein